MASCCESCTFTDVPIMPNACAANYVVFMTMVDYLIRSSCKIADPCSRVGSNTPIATDSEFDFIVVGSGPAGSAVASRLSETPDWTVALFEAGPEEPSTSQVPAFSMSGVGSAVDWKYATVPQETACLVNGGVCGWPRGKMLGGTGSMNGMMYTRGHSSWYDKWASAGNEGWSYQDVLPYFIKAETNGNPDEVEAAFHGTTGPLNVERYPYYPPLGLAVIQAGKELGYEQRDLNGANQTGFNLAQMMVKDGIRVSPAKAYLRNIGIRQNLYVLINSHVTKVIIDPVTAVARGIEYIDSQGVPKRALARKEVILSAGAVGSPQLLLLSGVGPSADLEALGIPVIQDLPVGENLHNHAAIGIGFTISDPSVQSLTSTAVKDYLENNTGPLSSTGLTQVTGFLTSPLAENGVPDLQIFFDGFTARCTRTGLPEECTDGSLNTCSNRFINARPTLLNVKSKGFLKLNSSDPLDHPIINPRYLTDEHDIQVLVEGLKIAVRLTETNTLQAWGFTLAPQNKPLCDHLSFPTDEYYRCLVVNYTSGENHPAGSCKMGPAGDPTAVVDPQLRVHGVQNLRVVDASIFPDVPNSNPTAPIIMAGEKLADMVKQTWATFAHT